jgi:LPXTG-site transpeptidase (sortase) family protein
MLAACQPEPAPEIPPTAPADPVALKSGSNVVIVGIDQPTAVPVSAVSPTVQPTQQKQEEKTPTVTVSDTTAPKSTATLIVPDTIEPLEVTETPEITIISDAPTALPPLEEMITPTATPVGGVGIPIYLSIERLNLETQVFVVGLDAQGLIWAPEDAAGYYKKSARIGADGNTIIVGHVYPGRAFHDLIQADFGDLVKVTDHYYVDHWYQVEEIRLVPAENATQAQLEETYEEIFQTEGERLTLITCYPVYTWTHRAVVIAYPIDGPEALETPIE